MEDVNVFVYVRGTKENKKQIVEYLESLGGVDSPLGDIKDNQIYLFYINTAGNICSCLANKWLSTHYTEVKLDFKYQPKDKELVWAWNNDMLCARALCFYDKKKNCTFNSTNGAIYGYSYDNYAPYKGEVETWMEEAKAKLED